MISTESSKGCARVQDNAKTVQRRLLSKRRQPVELAADVIEHVLETGGEPYMRTKENTLSWWQLSLLDVKLFLAARVALPVGLLLLAIWLVVNHFTVGKPASNSKSTRKGVKVA